MENPEQIDIEQQIKEAERKLQELKEQAEAEKVLTLTLSKVTASSFSVKSDIYRKDYTVFKQTEMRFYHDTYTSTDRFELKEWEKWKAWVDAAKNVKLDARKEQLNLIHYYLYEPDVKVELHKTELRLKVKANVDFQLLLGELYQLARYNGSTSKYHYPLNEAAKLYKKCQNTIYWEPDALEFAVKQLEVRSKLSDIAALGYSEAGDITLANGNALKPFQTVGVHYISAINYRGVIGDEMGLGKTAQGIAAAMKAEAKRIAVIVPASVRENWRREILKYAGESSCMMMGTVPQTWDMSLILSGKYRWFIFNYDQFSRPVVENANTPKETKKYPWTGIINSLLFDFVILDEAHRIKNVSASRTQAMLGLTVPKILGLTGTPILNRPGELWSILHLLAPEAFNSYEGFLARYTDGKNGARNTNELKELIAPYFIRRRKKDVMKDLPPIIRNTRYVDLSTEDLTNYRKLMDQIRIDLRTGDELGTINNVLEKILRIKQFLSLRKLDAVADFAVETYDEAEDDEQYKKIIIFSQFVPCVEEISKRLGGECLQIIGSKHPPMERQHIVDEFQTNPKYKFLVCSTQAANEGLNITIAGHVIFNDFMWTPAAHAQAEGRAYGRLNDAHTIESHYFAVPNTLDDWLQGILMEKIGVIEEVIEGMGEARTQESSIFKALFSAIRRGEI